MKKPQNTEQLARTNTANIVANEAAVGELVQNVFLALATDPALADVVSRGMQSLSTLDANEQRRFRNYMRVVINFTQVWYLNYRRGASSDAYCQAHAGLLVSLMRSPGGVEWWRSARTSYLPEARAFIDGLTGDRPLQPPGLFADHPALTNTQAGEPTDGAPVGDPAGSST